MPRPRIQLIFRLRRLRLEVGISAHTRTNTYMPASIWPALEDVNDILDCKGARGPSGITEFQGICGTATLLSPVRAVAYCRQRINR
jgi:hypothetical protein